ncbi:MAG: hypothetical protein AB1486_21975, partial [Planctomycetota bacterium]
WSSTATWNPAGGVVRLDSAAACTASGSLTFFDLQIAEGTKTIAALALVKQNLTVMSGTLDADAALDVNGSVTVSAGATFDTGTSTHKVAASWTSNASGATTTGTGTIEFDGDGTVVTGVNSIPNMLVSAGSRLVNSSDITGDLAMTGGAITILYPTTTTVGGDATFTGGTFSGSWGGPSYLAILDVAGDVFMGATAGNLYSTTYIYCAGNWTSSSVFTPTEGTVELDGTGATTVSGAPPGFDPVFYRLTLKNGTRRAGNDFLARASTFTIEAGARFDLNGKTVRLVSTPITVNGTLEVDAGGALKLNATSSVTVSSGGALRLLGSMSRPALVGGEAGGGYSFLVNGTIEGSSFVFQEMSAAGIRIPQVATIGAMGLRAAKFRNGAGTAGSVLIDIQRPSATTFFGWTFSDPSTAGSNVRTLAGASISIRPWSGNFGGESYDDDPLDLVTWGTEQEEDRRGSVKPKPRTMNPESPPSPSKAPLEDRVMARPRPIYVGHDGPGALARAVLEAAPFSTLVVGPGTYSSFVISKAITIIAGRGGNVSIDTAEGPLTISDLLPDDRVYLSGLEVGSSETAAHGIVMTSNEGLVVLDDLAVRAGPGFDAARAEASSRVAIQSCTLEAAIGLRATASTVYVAGGELDAVVARQGTRLRYAGVEPRGVLNEFSDVVAVAGDLPSLDVPAFLDDERSVTLRIAGSPGAVYGLFVSPSEAWIPLGGGIDMVLLVDPAVGLVAARGILGGGQLELTFPVPEPIEPEIGPLWIQALQLVATGPVGRLSGVHPLWLLPWPGAEEVQGGSE